MNKYFKENTLFFGLLTPIFLLVNGVLGFYLGVSLDDDSQRYLGYAEEMRERGLFFKPHDFWYIGYPLFILLMQTAHSSLEMVVVGQVMVSYVALWGIYKAGKTLFSDNKAGLVAGFLFLGFVMITYWNFWILCESMLISLNSLVFSLLVLWQVKKDKRYLVFGLLIFALAFFTKPTGVALLAAVLVLIFRKLWMFLPNAAIKTSLTLFGLLAFFFLLNQMLTTFGYVDDYQRGEIVYNIHKLTHEPYAKYLIVTSPEDLYIPPSHFPALAQFILVIFGNPLYSFQLIFTKLFFYLLYIRPYFSFYHNGLALLFLVPVYLGFIKEMKGKGLPDLIKLFVGVFIGVNVLSSVLLTVDWNSRFLVSVLPVVFVIASAQLLNFLMKIQGSCFFQRPKLNPY
ncbi:glycosyltransferase family 39 protein [Pleomorphovibrio marinus]|uniref:glycosyltransferase family 39 protein n=1 Tax=Pleomorphovibrio marinus TaxID=2164132 RepID=UPI000E0AF3E3|nr:glycosyltransferase family 39 protein [Pleomorphovibrio marinus]